MVCNPGGGGCFAQDFQNVWHRRVTDRTSRDRHALELGSVASKVSGFVPMKTSLPPPTPKDPCGFVEYDDHPV